MPASSTDAALRTKPVANRKRVVPQPRFYSRSTAAALAGYTVRTLDRRERVDPDIPERVALGPGGGPPYAYVAPEWDAYLAERPRIPRPVGVDNAEHRSATFPGVRRGCGAGIPESTPAAAQQPPAKAPTARQGSTPTSKRERTGKTKAAPANDAAIHAEREAA